MTVSELYNQTAQLGFEDSLESGERFYFAANRALLQVSALRPAISSFIINHKPMKNMASRASFAPIERDTDLCFTATGVKSYYFEADGNGVVYLEAQNGNEWNVIGRVELSGTRRFTAYKGFIRRDGEFTDATVRLRFSGPYLYSVKSVALYRHIYSDSVDDIPAYEPFTAYDMSVLAKDFLSLSSPPISDDGGYTVLNQGFRIENGCKVLLPYDASGLYKILYRRRPNEISSDDDAATNADVIDLDEELCTLLPILIASYVWVEDEPDMAEYYLNLYRERSADIERRHRNAAPVIIRNKNGW